MSQFGRSSDPSEADDALFISDDTDVSEVQNFIQRRTENPVVVDGTPIWNYSSYEVNQDALETAVRYKLNNNKYYIPYQVTGTWGFMFSMLPEAVQQAEILVYQPSRGEYFAYNNFIRDISREQRDAFTQDLARRVADIDV